MNPLLTPTTHTDLEMAARELMMSGYYEGDSSQAYLKMLLGTTLGLTIFESLHAISYENKRVILEHPMLMERVIKRSGTGEVKIVTSTDDMCELNFFEMAKIKGNSKVTADYLRKKGLTPTKEFLYDVAMAQGVQQYFSHLFGHRFYLRSELPATAKQRVEAIMEQAGQSLITADQLKVPKHPTKRALSIDSQKLMDWKTDLASLSPDDAAQWDAHAVKLYDFGFLNTEQKDDQFSQLLAAGMEVGIEYNADTTRFYATENQLIPD